MTFLVYSVDEENFSITIRAIHLGSCFPVNGGPEAPGLIDAASAPSGLEIFFQANTITL